MKWLLSLYFTFMVVIRPVLPLVDYTVSYRYIITQLCENRSRPQLLCNGRCYLEKELKKNQDTQKSDTSLSLSLSSGGIFLPADIFDLDKIPEELSIKKAVFPRIICFFSFSFFREIFHPPLSFI
ncbi:hypothetical protein AAH994_07470 [Weeksellaceae bacterium A-14]